MPSVLKIRSIITAAQKKITKSPVKATGIDQLLGGRGRNERVNSLPKPDLPV